MIFWIAGLSGSGKTTIGRELVSILRNLAMPSVLLDGDELRGALHLHNYSEQGRFEVGQKYVRLAQIVAAQGLNVVIAAGGLSPQLHPWAREHTPRYRAILLDVPLAQVRIRDTKSLYSRASRGEIRNLAGFDTKIALPEEFDGVISWEPRDTPEITAKHALALWQRFYAEFS